MLVLCREGLDWLVHECSLRALRLLPVLTNGGSAEAGGMKQYIDWIDPALTVTAFYTNDTIKVGGAFLCCILFIWALLLTGLMPACLGAAAFMPRHTPGHIRMRPADQHVTLKASVIR